MKLLDNNFYNSAESDPSNIAVYDTASGISKADGWYSITEPDEILGKQAKKVHINSEWSYEPCTGLPMGELNIHCEPKSLKLEMNTAEWLVIADGSAYIKGRAEDESGSIYTVILMMEEQRAKEKPEDTVSLVIWKGDCAQGTPVYRILGQELNGRIDVGINGK